MKKRKMKMFMKRNQKKQKPIIKMKMKKIKKMLEKNQLIYVKI